MSELQIYLDSILSKEQQPILAYCVKNNINVCVFMVQVLANH